jgi:hypothetical protein
MYKVVFIGNERQRDDFVELFGDEIKRYTIERVDDGPIDSSKPIKIVNGHATAMPPAKRRKKRRISSSQNGPARDQLLRYMQNNSGSITSAAAGKFMSRINLKPNGGSARLADLCLLGMVEYNEQSEVYTLTELGKTTEKTPNPVYKRAGQ